MTFGTILKITKSNHENRQKRDLQSSLNSKNQENQRLQSRIEEYQREERYNENNRDAVCLFAGMIAWLKVTMTSMVKQAFDLRSSISDRAKYIREFFTKKYPTDSGKAIL